MTLECTRSCYQEVRTEVIISHDSGNMGIEKCDGAKESIMGLSQLIDVTLGFFYLEYITDDEVYHGLRQVTSVLEEESVGLDGSLAIDSFANST